MGQSGDWSRKEWKVFGVSVDRGKRRMRKNKEQAGVTAGQVCSKHRKGCAAALRTQVEMYS